MSFCVCYCVLLFVQYIRTTNGRLLRCPFCENHDDVGPTAAPAANPVSWEPHTSPLH